jgi:hypothetical protein
VIDRLALGSIDGTDGNPTKESRKEAQMHGSGGE